MENIILAGIGLAALGYIIRLVWRGINGKAGCSCESASSCPSSGGGCCHCDSARTPK